MLSYIAKYLKVAATAILFTVSDFKLVNTYKLARLFFLIDLARCYIKAPALTWALARVLDLEKLHFLFQRKKRG